MKNGWYERYGHLYHYVDDKLHNEKCPSIIWNNRNKYWKQNNKRHRIDGPAIEYYDEKKYWYYQGKRIDCNSQKEFDRYVKLKSLW